MSIATAAVRVLQRFCFSSSYAFLSTAAASAHATTPAPPCLCAQEHQVFIKRTGVAPPVEGEVFAELSIFPGDTMARLTKRACVEFGWGAPTLARLHLVPHPPGGDEPSAEVEAAALRGARLQSGWTLERAGVVPGSWLLARFSLPAAGAGASWRGRARAREM